MLFSDSDTEGIAFPTLTIFVAAEEPI